MLIVKAHISDRSNSLDERQYKISASKVFYTMGLHHRPISLRFSFAASAARCSLAFFSAMSSGMLRAKWLVPYGTALGDASASASAMGAASIMVAKKMNVARSEREIWKWKRMVVEFCNCSSRVDDRIGSRERCGGWEVKRKCWADGFIVLSWLGCFRRQSSEGRMWVRNAGVGGYLFTLSSGSGTSMRPQAGIRSIRSIRSHRMPHRGVNARQRCMRHRRISAKPVPPRQHGVTRYTRTAHDVAVVNSIG